MMRIATFLTAFALVWVSAVDAKPKPVSLSELEPTKDQAEAAIWAMRHLTRIHYKSEALDDAMSAEIFSRYLDSLDGDKWFLLASDVEEFEPYRTTLDDAIKTKALGAAFTIYKRYLKRVGERTAYARSLVKKGFDFTIDEDYVYDREDAPYATSKAELDDLWRRRVKNDWLRLSLAGKEDAEIQKTLDRRYADFQVRVEQLDREDVFQTFLNAYAMAIEPHTSYLGPRASENFAISMRLSLEGIGAVLQREGEYTMVRTIVPGGPLDLDGRIKTGDKIVGVGQPDSEEVIDVVGWRLDDVVDLIRGPKGTEVRLEVLPKTAVAGGETKIVALQRDKVALEEQAAKKKVIEVEIDDQKRRIGVVELPTFYMDFAARQRGDADYRSSTRDVSALIKELKKENVDGVVIDLRNNGGGSLAEATDLTGLFIDSGPVVQVRDSSNRTTVERDRRSGVVYDGPLAVLVNRASASASEIFAAAIQDYGRGLVIGETTFGKGTVQNLVDLDYIADNDSAKYGQLKMTIAQFFRIDGSSTQHKGVIPDVSFPTTIDADEYGESTYDNALPYTEIAPVSYHRFSTVATLSQALEARHQKRAAADEELQLFFEEIADYKQARARKSVSLNLATRQRERAEEEQKQADRDARRVALGEESHRASRLDDGLNAGEPGAAVSELDDEDEEERPDVLLTEAARILGDAIAIGGPLLAAQVDPTTDSNKAVH